MAEADMALEVTILQPVPPKTVVAAMIFFLDKAILVPEVLQFVKTQLPDCKLNSEYIITKVYSSAKALDLPILESDWKMIPQFRSIKLSQVFFLCIYFCIFFSAHFRHRTHTHIYIY